MGQLWIVAAAHVAVSASPAHTYQRSHQWTALGQSSCASPTCDSRSVAGSSDLSAPHTPIPVPHGTARYCLYRTPHITCMSHIPAIHISAFLLLSLPCIDPYLELILVQAYVWESNIAASKALDKRLLAAGDTIQPCLTTTGNWLVGDLKVVARCEDPNRHIFW